MSRIPNVSCNCGEVLEFKVDKPQQKFENVRIKVCNGCGHRWITTVKPKKKYKNKRVFDKDGEME